MICKAFWVLVFPWAAVVTTPAGADWYVSKTGSSTPPYRSPATAAHDIQTALNEAAPYGGFVWVAEGEYVGNIVVPEGIYLTGEGPRRSRIVGVPTDDLSQPVVALTHDDHLYGFSVRADGLAVGVRCTGGLAFVHRCQVSGAESHGVRGEDSCVLISGCRILANGSAGVSSYNSVFTVVDSVVACNRYGILCDGYELVMSHCTVVDNLWSGIDNLNASPCYIRDSIIYRNGEDLSEVPAWSVVNCVVGTPDITGVNGNLSVDPLFVGWGDFNDIDNPILVDASHTGPTEGSETNPFRTITAALDAYEYRLALGSPCVGAASDGRNIGASPDAVADSPPGSPSVLVNVRRGLYPEGRLPILHRAQLKGPGPHLAVIAPPRGHFAGRLGLGSSIDGFKILVAQACGLRCVAGSSPTIANCVISSSELSPHSGVDIGVTYGSPSITNCLIYGMRKAIAGPALVRNCTLTGNREEPFSFHPDNAATVANSIIWANGSQDPPLPPENVSYSLVSDPSLDGINGNIYAHPRFVDAENGDFRLLPDSPCIDVGFNDPELPETDIVGMHRIMFGGKSLTVDMGAYEFYINRVAPVPDTDEAIFTWSSLADRTYSIFYSGDLLTWHLAIESFPSAGNQTTSWTDDGTLTGLPPLLAPRRFYRLLENP